ncbi:hypothetical protein TRFO_03314 [Tritrichomonas foetus]|uniref:Importin N-terminal domain-containing protein n=1 Tax=Tritrichomonas foetus TaxID=1144522 RepID=A0A1J4KQN2_9EUKA|nr:hypothetical protein TRFO_03314 [Tritrichomonas foetus]|eukprot:OHT13563.1 hypothetical protein TRFO_03314 [Tritrichomonas foetus]
MEFNLEQVFTALLRGTNDQIREANDIILRAMQNPQFIFLLLSNLTEQLMQTNPTLYTQLQLAVLTNIRDKWTAVFKPDEPIFWTSENQQSIIMAILNALFTIPIERRSHYIAAIDFIVQKCFSDLSVIPEAMTILKHLIELYVPRSQSVFDSNTFLQVARVWFRARHKRSIYIEKKKLNGQIEPVDNELLNYVLNIIPMALGSFTQSRDACVILCNSIKIIKYSITYVSDFLANQTFQQLLTQILQIIPLPTSDENDDIIQVKIMIFKLIDFMDSSFLCKHMKVKTDIRISFANVYREQIVPSIIQLTIQMLNLNSNYELKLLTMNVFYQFLFYQVANTAIFTPDFIMNVLFKYARVEEDDVTQPLLNPDMYISQHMSNDLAEKPTSPRTYCSLIIDVAVNKLHLHEQLYQFLISPASDIFDFEAKLFLFKQYIKSVMKLEKNERKKLTKKAQKRRPPITPHIRPEEFQVILNSLNDPKPPFAQVTIILFLSSVLKYINPQLGFQLAQQIILTSDEPIIRYCGAKLFNNCSPDDDDEFPALENVTNLIHRVLEIIPIFKNHIPSDMISKICSTNTEHLTNFGCELITVLFDQAIVISSTDQTTCDTIFNNIFNIIAAYNDDDPMLVPMLDFCCSKTAALLVENPMFESTEKLYDLISLINQKLTHSYPSQITILNFFMQFWQNENDFILYAKQVCQMIYPLITGQDRILTNAPELVQMIISLTTTILEKGRDPDLSDNYSMGYGLFLASCLVQVFGDINDVFLQAAMSVIAESMNDVQNEGIKPDIFNIIAAMHVTAAYFVVNPQKMISVLNPPILEFLTGLVRKRDFTTYRELVIGFINLLNFTKMGYQQAYLTTAKLLPTLVEYKRIADSGVDEVEEEEEEAEEDENDENEGDDDDDDDEKDELITPFAVPFDTFDVITLFKEVSDQTGLFASLPPELQQKIMSILN